MHRRLIDGRLDRQQVIEEVRHILGRLVALAQRLHCSSEPGRGPGQRRARKAYGCSWERRQASALMASRATR